MCDVLGGGIGGLGLGLLGLGGMQSRGAGALGEQDGRTFTCLFARMDGWTNRLKFSPVFYGTSSPSGLLANRESLVGNPNFIKRGYV